MASTFDHIAEPTSEEANHEFTYQNNKLNHWLNDTFSTSYGRTAEKFRKYKRYILWKWKVILLAFCLWMSVVIPVIILWQQMMILKLQVSPDENPKLVKSYFHQADDVLVEVEEEQDYVASSTISDVYFYSSSSSGADSSSSSTPSSISQEMESLIEEKLASLMDKLQCVGPPGPKGEMGSPGIGSPGNDGHPGSPGQPGTTGPSGPKGETGQSGFVGAKGEKGSMGISFVGEKGAKGERGYPGPQGLEGLQGPKGDRGSRFFGR